jgi:glycine/D-amino acid oxidase-like deaminating enzyme
MAKKIIVIGAGIIGASIAYHLAKAGAEVLVVDSQSAVGRIATPNSWAWINASWGNPEPYAKLRMRAMQEWRSLATVHPDLVVNWCGGLLWDLPQDELIKIAETQKSWGYDVEVVDGAAALNIEPRLHNAPELALHAAGEGSIEPAAAARGFLSAAKDLGVKIFTDAIVTGFQTKADRVTGVKIAGRTYEADEVVVAAGAQSPALLAELDMVLNLDSPAGLLVHSEPTPRLLNGLVMAPELHVRQTTGGQLVAGSDFGGTQPGDDPAATAAILFAKVQALIRGAENLKLDFYTMGYRPTPRDGLPLTGRPAKVGGLYVAVMHSGVTLAPAIGWFAAAEILQDMRNPLLIPFHVDRP